MSRAAPEKLDCYASVVTPENIEFEYSLAGPFQRLPAFIFDFAVRVLAFLAIVIIGALALSWIPLGQYAVGVLSLLLFFFMSWFYGIYFESRFSGRTPGKMVFRLRVISVDGRPISAVQAGLRNLLRLADMNVLLSLQLFDPEAPPAYVIPTMLVGLVVMTITRRFQRIGDLAAGTMVVSEQVQRSPWNLQPDDLRAFGLAELIPATFRPSTSMAQTIGLYMENRKRLSPQRRLEIARVLAEPLTKRFELLPDTSGDLLLCALYVRIFMSQEQQMQGKAKMRAVGDTVPVQSRVRHLALPPAASAPAANAMGNSSALNGTSLTGNAVTDNAVTGTTVTETTATGSAVTAIEDEPIIAAVIVPGTEPTETNGSGAAIASDTIESATELPSSGPSPHTEDNSRG